jgi:hypothetical protein
VKTAPLDRTQSTKTCWINLAQQTEQRLTRGSLHFIAQNLQIKRLIPIDSNGSLPALPLQECQLFRGVVGGLDVQG